MKRICMIALVLALCFCLLTGCFGSKDNGTNSTPSTSIAPTQAPTSRPTMPSTDSTMPSMDDILPGTEDTINPTNGANQDGNNTNGRTMPSKY